MAANALKGLTPAMARNGVRVAQEGDVGDKPACPPESGSVTTEGELGEGAGKQQERTTLAQILARSRFQLSSCEAALVQDKPYRCAASGARGLA